MSRQHSDNSSSFSVRGGQQVHKLNEEIKKIVLSLNRCDCHYKKFLVVSGWIENESYHKSRVKSHKIA